MNYLTSQQAPDATELKSRTLISAISADSPKDAAEFFVRTSANMYCLPHRQPRKEWQCDHQEFPKRSGGSLSESVRSDNEGKGASAKNIVLERQLLIPHGKSFFGKKTRYFRNRKTIFHGVSTNAETFLR